jgi:hypothetical protein
MSTLKVNTIQSNTTSELDINSPLGTVPSLDVINSVTVGGNINAVGVITATSFRGDGGSLTGIAATTNVRTNSLVVTGVSTFTTLTVQDNSSPEKLATISASSVGVGTGLLVEVSTNSSGQITSINPAGIAGGNAYGYGNGDIVTLDGPGSPTSKIRIGISQVTPPNGLAAILSSQVSLPAGSGYTPNQTNVLASTTNITARVYSLPAAKLPTTAFTPIPTTVLVGANSDQTLTNKIIIAGAGTSTGTASQTLQVTGGAYVSGNLGIGSTNPARKLDVVDSGASGSVIRSRVTTNNGGYLAYEALNSSGTSVFSVTHNGRINLSENIVFASGQGLDFSATANSSGTMTSELLSDYEEGTFSPFSAADVTNRGISIPNQAFYIKIGRICHIWFRFSYSNTASSSPISGNLPFAGNTPTLNPAVSPFFLSVFPKNGSPSHMGFCYNDANGAAFTFYQNNANYINLNWNSGCTEYTVIGAYQTT